MTQKLINDNGLQDWNTKHQAEQLSVLPGCKPVAGCFVDETGALNIWGMV
jgi:hypothetical protein